MHCIALRCGETVSFPPSSCVVEGRVEEPRPVSYRRADCLALSAVVAGRGLLSGAPQPRRISPSRCLEGLVGRSWRGEFETDGMQSGGAGQSRSELVRAVRARVAAREESSDPAAWG